MSEPVTLSPLRVDLIKHKRHALSAALMSVGVLKKKSPRDEKAIIAAVVEVHNLASELEQALTEFDL